MNLIKNGQLIDELCLLKWLDNVLWTFNSKLKEHVLN